MKKRRILLILVAILLLQVPMAAFGADFPDAKGHWAEGYIDWATNAGFIQGYPDGTFGPDNPITNAEYYRITNQAIPDSEKKEVEKKAQQVKDTFDDVKDDAWYSKEVKKGIAKGYIKGDGNLINPNQPITREDAIRIMGFNEKWPEEPGALSRFRDSESVDPSFRGLVGAAVSRGIINGYPDGSFKPKGQLTRAEVVTILGRARGYEPGPGQGDDWHWTFSNSGDFFNQGILILDKDWELAASLFTPSDVQTIKALQAETAKEGWGGSCFGFAATTAFYNNGNFKVNDLNSPATDSIARIKPEADQYRPQSILNLYQCSQWTQALESVSDRSPHWKRQGKANNPTIASFADDARALLEREKSRGKMTVFGFYWWDEIDQEIYGHAVTPYDFEDDGNVLTIRVYDPNLRPSYFVLDRQADTATAYNTGINAGQVEEYLDLLEMDLISAEEYTSNMKRDIVSGDLTVRLPQNKDINVSTNGGPATKLTPDSENVRARRSYDSSVISYIMPDSDYYVFSGPGANKFTANGKDYGITVDADSVRTVSIKDKVVNLEGQSGNYKISVTDDKNDSGFRFNTIEVEGRDAGKVRLARDENGYELTGDNLSGVVITGYDGSKPTQPEQVGNMVQGNKAYIRTDDGSLTVSDKPGGGSSGSPDSKYDDIYVEPSDTDFVQASWRGKIAMTKNGVITDYAEMAMFFTKTGTNTYKATVRNELSNGTYFTGTYGIVNYDPAEKKLNFEPSSFVIHENNTGLKLEAAPRFILIVKDNGLDMLNTDGSVYQTLKKF